MTLPPVGDVRRAPPRRPALRRRPRRDQHTRAARAERRPPPTRVTAPGILRYLPLALLTTTVALALPATLAARLTPGGGALSQALSAALAVVFSLALTTGLAALWKRRRASAELVFSDLLLWGFAHRWLVDRRVREVQSSYELAARNNEVVRVPQLEGLARLLERRDGYTHGHCRRVASHAERVAVAMHLSPAAVAKVRTAALVHDVGKVYTPREILHKPGPLTDEEYAIIKRHAVDGAEMVAAVRDRELELIVRHHHERIDGSGYPDGLAGEEIPLGARIIAVADTFDAVTSPRPYRPARSQRAGLALLAEERGKQLDARAVDAFLSGCHRRREVASFAALAAVFGRLAEAWRLAPFLSGAGSSVVAPLAAALGAAGIAAAAHPHVSRGHAAVHAGAPARLLTTSSPARGSHAIDVAPAHTRAPSGTGHPVARRLTHAGTGVAGTTYGSSAPPSPGRTSPDASSPPAGGSNGVLSLPVQTPVPVRTPGVPVGAPPVSVPSPPPVTPPVTPPPVGTPPVSTPPVTTPPVSVGAVTVPSATVPPATVPPVQIP